MITQAQRDTWRLSWRRLNAAAIAAIDGGPAERQALDQLARGARDWVTPTPSRVETMLCASVINAGRMFADPDGNAAFRADVAFPLRRLVDMLDGLLNATEPAAPPARPFRADIDG